MIMCVFLFALWLLLNGRVTVESCLFGAVIAFGLQWLLYSAMANGISNSDTMQQQEVVPIQQIWQPVAGIFAGAGILIGVGGSLMAIRRFLKV